MNKMTPQIAKMIVLRLQLESTKKYYEIVDANEVPLDDRPVFRQAIDNAVSYLKDAIAYQTRMVKGLGK